MPYARDEDLPEAVREHLPAHAREIYRKAFNNAWEEYASPAERRHDDSREEVSHKVAWAAVKKAGYARGADGDWHRHD